MQTARLNGCCVTQPPYIMLYLFPIKLSVICGGFCLRVPTGAISRKSSKNAIFGFCYNNFRHSNFIFFNHFPCSGHKIALT